MSGWPAALVRGWRQVRRRPIDQVDLTDPEFCQDPFPHYARLLRHASVHRRRVDDYWYVLGYDDVDAAFMQPKIFSSRPMAVYDPHVLGADPPTHTVHRRAIAKEFTAFVSGIDEIVTPLAEERLATLSKQPAFDALNDFVRPVIDRVAGRVLGFHDEQVRRISAAVGDGRSELATGFQKAVPIMEEVLRETGLPVWLPPNPEAQSLEAAAAFARFIWTASTRTSRQTLSNCLLELMRSPSLRHEVVGHPELIPALIEEVVRLDPGEHLLLRETSEAATLPSARIPKGAPVMLCLAAANRDPARFERPHEIWLHRPSNPHFGFGKGHHKCPGANIARAQVAAALRVWLQVLPEFEPAEPLSSIRYLGGTSMRILERLMVTPRT